MPVELGSLSPLNEHRDDNVNALVYLVEISPFHEECPRYLLAGEADPVDSGEIPSHIIDC